MDFLKQVFEDKALTFDEFAKALDGNEKIKLANIAGGTYVSRDKFDDVDTQLKAANGTIKELQDAVAKFDGVDVEGLKSAFSEKETAYQTEISGLKLSNAIDASLFNAKVRDTVSVKAHLNMDAIKMSEDGGVLGLNEQLEKIKTEKAYLFGDEKTDDKFSRASTGMEHGKIAEIGDSFVDAALAGAGLKIN